MLVFGPSGAGKTYLSKTHPNLFKDGDELIKETIGWPPGRWWETFSTDELRVFNSAIDDVLSSYTGDKILLSAPSTHPTVGTRLRPNFVFLPSRERLFSNYKAKADAGVVNQPHTKGEANVAYDQWLHFAIYHGLPTVDSAELVTLAEDLHASSA